MSEIIQLVSCGASSPSWYTWCYITKTLNWQEVGTDETDKLTNVSPSHYNSSFQEKNCLILRILVITVLKKKFCLYSNLFNIRHIRFMNIIKGITLLNSHFNKPLSFFSFNLSVFFLFHKIKGHYCHQYSLNSTEGDHGF